MHDLTDFSLVDMTELGAALRRIARESASLEAAASGITRHLMTHLVDRDTKEPQCALVRFFKTHPFADLPASLQEFAARVLGERQYAPEVRCLTLLGSSGTRPDWHGRAGSKGHQAIPLPSVQIVSAAPMIASLIKQLGLELSAVVEPSTALFLEMGQRSFDVFHVPEAVGSPYVPAQDEFVRPFGIRSVLGCGGLLSTGDLFALILFSRAPIDRDVAEMFATVALNVKAAILPLDRRVFARSNEGS